MKDIKRLIRIATITQQALVRLRNNRYTELLRQLKYFADQLSEITTQSQKLGISLTHEWFAAADRCSSKVSRLLSDVSYSVSRVQPLTDSLRKEIPRLPLLIEEMRQVQDEFGDMEFDDDERMLSVVTEPITLEDLYLGPFKIQLELDKFSELYTSIIYQVIALDPHPAATDEAVTHPHVSNDQLCEGDGAAAIRAALEQGRLCDFFTTVRSILNTHNPDSAYVSLYDWDGEPCYDCGHVVDRENCYYCSFCDHDYCEQCSSYCQLCDETVCLGCGGEYPQCGELVCPNCISRCAECDSLCCKECLDENICPNCKEESEAENEEQGTEIDTDRERGSQSEPSNAEANIVS